MRNNLTFIVVFTSLVALSFFLPGCEKEEKNTPPVASFIITPDSGIPGTVITFNATASSDAEDLHATLLVRWDWETDGLFDTDFSTNKVISNPYSQPGTFQVTLEVKDSKELGNAITKTLTITGKIPDVTTDTVSGISANSAICGGEVVDDFGMEVTGRGVCWSISTNPTISDSYTDDGSGTGKFESILTGLTTNTTYFVRAYATNSIGTAYGNQVKFTTLIVWSCGGPITVSHIAGVVAPVTKTVTYGTITNIPGATTKCWITQNLGADHQAQAVDDATEESAGWYWQFNRKQGFKHDGITRTPNTTWIDNIVENSNWTASTDPCNLELGNGWHIPSQSEWVNTDNGGGWNNLHDTWNSGLKLHAAGDIYYTTGLLVNRGIIGTYWSNLQGESFSAWYLWITGSVCEPYGLDKEYGLTIRCIRDL